MSHEEEHEDPDHPSRRPVPYTTDEGVAALASCMAHHITYPQGTPVDATVTLTDEHWNAVKLAISMVMIAESTENNGRLPDFILDQMHEAMHAIHDTAENAIQEDMVSTFAEHLDEFIESTYKEGESDGNDS